MMKKKILFSLLVAMGLLMFNCTNDSEDDLIDNTPPPDLVTYDENIKAIIDTNCTVCHSNPPVAGATTPLVTYDDVVLGVQNNNLIPRISSQPGEAGAMPLGGPRLPQNLIDLVVQWQTDGLPESE